MLWFARGTGADWTPNGGLSMFTTKSDDVGSEQQ
jgi:hypothetical protein